MCFASPWADHLAAIIEEVLSTYEVDGILLDCFLWNRACYGDECLAPQNEDIPWRGEDGRIEFAIPQVQGYQMVVIE